MSRQKRKCPELTTRVALSAADVERALVAEFARRGFVVAPGTRPEVVGGAGGVGPLVVGVAFEKVVAAVLVKPIAPTRGRA